MIPGHRCHILHVTSSRAAHRLLQEVLGVGSTPKLLQAVTGEEALVLLRSASPNDRPNVVLTSWLLPWMSGEDLLAVIKSDDLLRAIPVMVHVEGSALPLGATERIYGLGASCVMESSGDIDDLTTTMVLFQAFWEQVARLPFCDSEGKATSTADHTT